MGETTGQAGRRKDKRAQEGRVDKEKDKLARRGMEEAPGRRVKFSPPHLHLALDLEIETFVPLWVWAVGDGPRPQLLVRSGGQREAHIAVCLAHCPMKTNGGGKSKLSAQVQTGESAESEGDFRQVTSRAGRSCLSFRSPPPTPLPLTQESDSPETFVPEP